MTKTIDISGLSKAAVLATIFNASAPAGMGFLQAGFGPTVMSIEDAQAILDASSNRYFDYLFGRPLKLDLSEDMIDPWGFDRDNGGDGTTMRLIEELRKNGATDGDDREVTRKAMLIERANDAMNLANTQSSATNEGGIPTYTIGGSDVGDLIERAVDREVTRQGI